MLWDNKIYSCPVIDNGKVIGVIDLNDIVYYHLAAAKVGQDIVFMKYLSEEAKAEAKSGKALIIAPIFLHAWRNL